MNFVAIDFETANNSPASACAVGLAVVQDGQIVDKYYSLVRPLAGEFLPSFIAVHHIEPAMVLNAPTFAELWPELEKRIGSNPLVAHWTPFDKSVLQACLADMHHPPLPQEWICTVRLGRKKLPTLPNHKLDTLANHFDLDLDHHNAASDAIVAAQLAILMLK